MVRVSRLWWASLLPLLLLCPWLALSQTVPINANVVIYGHVNSCVATGATNTYACALDAPLTAYVPRACYGFTANAANTGPPTINFNTIGATPITKVQGGITTALVADDIRTGQIVHVCYDGTNMQCQNCLGNAASGTLAASGTPTAGQAAEWVTASTLQGVATTGTGSYVKATDAVLTTPFLASFANATHAHTTAAGGGQLTDAALASAVTVPKGGTGATALTGLVLGNGAAPMTTVAAPAGAVVGTTDTQTLSSKTLDLASNTVTGTLTQFNTAISDANVPPETRALTTTAPLGGGGNLTADRTLTCSTCTTNAAALTANHLVIGGGSQASAALGTLGTTTTLLHGNAAGAPTFGAVALGTDVSGTLPVGSGGTNLTAAADDNVMVGNGTTWQTKALPDCTDTGGNHLNYAIATNTWTCGTSGGTGGGITTDTAQRAAFYLTTTTVDGAPSLTFAADGTTITSYADRITTLSSSATLGVNDGPVVSCDATAGSVTATLPDGTTTTQRRWSIVKSDASANTCVIVPNATGTDTINGIAGTATLTARWDRYDVDLLSTATAANWAGAFGLAGPISVAQGGTGTASTLTGLVRGSASAMTAAELSGDVTTSGSNATTIANDAVTYAKLQNVSATDRFLGRDTAGAGDVEEISPAAAKTMLAIACADLTDDGGGCTMSTTAGGDLTGTLPAPTIATNAVTYAKMQDVSAASRLLGRGDSGAGDPQEITLGSGLTMAGTTLSVSAGGGNVSNTGTPVDNQVPVWTSSSVIEGTTALTYNAGTLGVGVAGTLGKLALAGNTSGVITIQPQAAAGTFNWNLPTTAGASGAVLTSAAGGAAPMTWTTLAASATTDTTSASNISAGTLAVARGGTGTGTTLTGLVRGSASAMTAAELSGAVTTSGSNTTVLASKFLTATKGAMLDTPVTGDSNKIQWYFPTAVTITRVACSISGTTSVTIQLDERAEATPNTAGTNVLTTALVCDDTTEATTTFTNATIAARVPLNLQITAVSGTPTSVRIHVEYTID